jgi:chemotaxis protein MotA
MLDGNVADFLNIPSVFIVFGGVIASTIVSYPMESLKNLGKLIGNAFKVKKVDYQSDIENIVKIANIARREGILALEESVKEMNDPFMQKGIMLIIDGSDPELVKSVLETELIFIKERHSSGQAILLQMSSFSPAFGMIGTLVGLINMLQRLDDPSTLGPSMAVALVTTFYGVVLANLLFTPFAKKLGVQSNEECLRKEMILEGILSIQDGENPRIIREKLNAFLSRSQISSQSAAQVEGTKE